MSEAESAAHRTFDFSILMTRRTFLTFLLATLLGVVAHAQSGGSSALRAAQADGNLPAPSVIWTQTQTRMLIAIAPLRRCRLPRSTRTPQNLAALQWRQRHRVRGQRYGRARPRCGRTQAYR